MKKNKNSKLPGTPDAGPTLPVFSDGITNITSGSGFIAVPNSVVNFSGTNTWSMEIWVYPALLVDNANLLSCAGEFALSSSNSTIIFSLTGQSFVLTAQEALQANTWTHIAVTFDSNIMALYVDGLLQVQSLMSGPGPAMSGNPIQAGGGFYGQLDSFRLWSIAVTANNIGDYQFVDYALGTPGLQAQIDLTQNPPADTSGQNVPVTQSPNGVQYVSYIPSVYLEGTAFVDTYADQNINPAGSAADFSIMAWVYPTVIGSDMYIFTNGINESLAGMSLMITASGNVEFQVGQSAALVSVSILSPGSWYNIAITWSASSTTGSIYINGTFDSSNSSMTLGGNTQPVGEPMIGAVVSNQSTMPVSTFTGYIQLISIWNSALPAAGIQFNLNIDPLSEAVSPTGTALGCIADYNLGMFPAQNAISGNPLGLVAGAETSTQGISSNLNLGGIRKGPLAGDVHRLAQKQTAEIPENWLEDGAFDVMLRDMIGIIQGQKITPEQEKAFGGMMQENLRRAFDDMKSGNYKSFIGDIEYTPEMLEIARQISVKSGVAITCVQCVVGLIVSIASLLLVVFSIPINGTTLTESLLNYLNNLPWIQNLIAAIQAMMPAPNPNPSQLFTFMKDVVLFLHKNQALTPILNLAFQAATSSVSWWTIITIMARIVIYFFPGAGQAWLAAQLAYSIVQLGIAINNCSGCTSSQASTPLLRAATS
jgi:hypothetical protein